MKTSTGEELHRLQGLSVDIMEAFITNILKVVLSDRTASGTAYQVTLLACGRMFLTWLLTKNFAWSIYLVAR